MTKIQWHTPGEKTFETGVDRGVLYPLGGAGVPWNGLTAVSEGASGGEIEALYFEGVKYVDVVAAEDFEATIEAFSAPREFDACEGVRSIAPGLTVSQQKRRRFAFSYRTLVGNDLEGTDFAYKLHLVYNCVVGPSDRSSGTLSSTPTVTPRQWTVSTVPPKAETHKPTAHLTIDSRDANPEVLAEVEAYLYGDAIRDAAMISLPELVALF